jgi:hypothetical protein
VKKETVILYVLKGDQCQNTPDLSFIGPFYEPYGKRLFQNVHLFGLPLCLEGSTTSKACFRLSRSILSFKFWQTWSSKPHGPPSCTRNRCLSYLGPIPGLDLGLILGKRSNHSTVPINRHSQTSLHLHYNCSKLIPLLDCFT